MNPRILIKVLKAAKPFLSKNGRGWKKPAYICQAIDEAYDKGLITSSEGYMVKDYISFCLDGSGSVYAWLLRNISRQLNLSPTGKTIQQYRHRWLDHMIAEAEKELASSQAPDA